MFQQVSDYNSPRWPDPARPQQAHLDLLVDDLDAGQARAVELGASHLNAGGERFRVFTRPGWPPVLPGPVAPGPSRFVRDRDDPPTAPTGVAVVNGTFTNSATRRRCGQPPVADL